MSWPVHPLSEICDISMGQAPVGSSYNRNDDGYALIAGAGDFGDFTPTPKKFSSAPTKENVTNKSKCGSISPEKYLTGLRLDNNIISL